ncbi:MULTISPECIES: Crp/Fnr family transcriptional regulator [unclassified Romboutsia]|uniref:Crp/Fnr family transcriptional regulator n=1 Tax=unclassified Romboutsia TaxID=2626894 RepID=UPI0008227889|nr:MULTISPECIES: Crp/Fnr family transcriptional regulator [unclassified Romboutsia]SCH07963.1 cAMP regulatory protein [uncultured Clostridium sp.]
MENIQVFKDIKDESKIEISKILSERVLKRKEILFNERDELDKLYFLKDGKISIFKMNESGERKIIFILKKGEMINEILIDNIKTSSIGCEAFEKSTILECKTSDFIKIMKNDFNLTKNIMLHIQNKNRRLYRQVKNSISIRIDKKLAAKLYRLGREFGIEKGEWTLINMNLTITYIADMLGCKRESLSRAMKVLQDEDLVRVDGKKVYVRKEKLSTYFKTT